MTIKQLIESQPVRFRVDGDDSENLLPKILKELQRGKLKNMLEGKDQSLTQEEYIQCVNEFDNFVKREHKASGKGIDFWWELTDHNGNFWYWKNEDSSVCCIGNDEISTEQIAKY